MTHNKKDILVISDNPLLLEFFQTECVKQEINKLANIKYCYSSTNKTPSSMIGLGATPIDIKNTISVNTVKNLYDLIFSIHCKQIFPANLVTSVTCINIHPGFNPYNRGWYPQVFSILNKNPIGSTIHIMDEAVDHGEIIDQIRVNILPSDTSKEVYDRVIESEKTLISNNLFKIVKGDFSATPASSDGNYNSIEDFNSLCNLNLDNFASLGEHIDLLRALSHRPFKNAFFINEQGKKVFIYVTLEHE